ncbi:MAG: heavy metal translocating P-type ATPase metal-binding domain-containing protein, partial [Flavobacterium sp.]|nr:heavy metal translocating P-type ATPase metal-binding domain-containing protein [Flavobacterium sp.]
MDQPCFHCGLQTTEQLVISFDDRLFCCAGCKTVYQIFSDNNLTSYYDFAKSPGATPTTDRDKFDFLQNEDIAAKLLQFTEGTTSIVTLNIPHIHCSSCIWILENLHRLLPHISSSQVNFTEKTVRIIFDNSSTSLYEIVQLLANIGYDPYISLDNYDKAANKSDNSLIYKLGIAFFSFGNIMLLSFPEYFEVGEYWIETYKPFFRWLIFLLALPPFLYSASGYYISAYKSLKSGLLNIDIPIALGIIVMFIRSAVDMVFDYGPGFFDSLTGLVFFMLLGKMFQIKTYNFLSFERDYKSYFPIAVTRISNGVDESVPVYDVVPGDRLLIRNSELIPADSILISEHASIDYSFVSGEADAVSKKSGDSLFAGGRQIGKQIEVEVVKPTSQSYLTQLWSHDVFQKDVNQAHRTITDKISRYFTPALLLIAFAGLGYWMFIDLATAFNVFTAVLIVACPCALALTAPFTFGNMLRIMGNRKFYLKNALAIEQLAAVDTIVFDKTGTLTAGESDISYEGKALTSRDLTLLKQVLRGSNHPLSRMLYQNISENSPVVLSEFEEITGSGIMAIADGIRIKIGSAKFIGQTDLSPGKNTEVHIAIEGRASGKFIFRNQYRSGLQSVFQQLSKKYDIKILSGDNDGERTALSKLLPANAEMVFNQKPEQKLEFIRQLQQQGRNVLMVGDGLNDAGALAQSNVGIS